MVVLSVRLAHLLTLLSQVRWWRGGDEAGEGPLPVVLASRPSPSRAGWWCSGGLWWGWQWGGRGPSPHHSTRQAQVLVN